MKKILIIDTTNEEVELWLCEGKRIVDKRRWLSEPALGRQILIELKNILEKNHLTWQEIDRIAVHRGPGVKSSALRSGVMVATGLGLSLGIEVVAIEGDGDPIKCALEAEPREMVEASYDRPGVE